MKGSDKLKKIIAVSLCAVLIGGAAVSLPAVIPESTIIANAEKSGDFEYYDVGGLLTITNYTGSASSVNIPSKINGENVQSIGEGAFSGNKNLKSVKIPDSVIWIRNSAFSSCKSLTNVTIPDSVDIIGFSAFSGCTSLKSIKLPGSIKSIRSGTFENCSSLTNVTIPDSVTEIGEWAFEECKNLESIKIPDSVTSIGSSAFVGCNSLTSISIPAKTNDLGGGYEENGYYPFDFCNKLTSINVDSGNKKYASYDGALYNKNKTHLLFCPDGKNTIRISDSVTTINDLAFDECVNLKSITIPNKVTTIGRQSFLECYSLTSITLPGSIKSIGEDAFLMCKNLKSINVDPSNKYFSSYDGILYDKNRTKMIYCPEGKKNIIIPDGVKSIGSHALENGTGTYESITIPGSVTSIDPEAIGVYKVPIRRTVYGIKGSAAEKFAKEYESEFVAGIAPTKLTLNKTAMTLGKGETVKLSAAVAPSNAVNKAVTWRTSDSKILTVDKNGNVKAVNNGTAWITGKTVNGAEQSCRITVKAAPQKITLTKGIVTIGVGESFTLGSGINDGAGCATRTYRTSNSSIAKMTRTDWNGVFVGVKPGVAYITVKTYNGKESTCKVTVKKAPQSVSLNKTAMTLKVGQTGSLSAIIASDAGCAARTFRTSNSSVVKMTKTNWTGEFKAVKKGVAYVTVRTYNGKEKSCKITVV